MDKEILEKFEEECRVSLSPYGIDQLRAYGRSIGVDKPTKKKRRELIDEIIGVLSGRLTPIERSLRGAPVKSDFVDPKIPEEIEKIRVRAKSGFPQSQRSILINRNIAQEIADFQARNKQMLVFNDPNAEIKLSQRCGQLTTLDGVSYLLPLNCRDNGEKVVMPVEFIREYDLKEGDVISCHVEKGKNVFVVVKLLSINQCDLNEYRRSGDFDEMAASYPKRSMRFYHPSCNDSIAAKYIDWLFAIGRGHRCRIVSPPKAGKTELICELVKSASAANPDVDVYVLLVEQSPETISRFRKLIKEDHLVYSTYDDSPERQVFTADFLLKRAKRAAECGGNVLLFVDSFNALARAFNDTAASSGGKMLACGLESKTVQYVKKYFGCARNLEKGGSVTIIGAVSCDSGSPADDHIAKELSTVANAEISLRESIAVQKIYPAVDLTRSATWNGVEKFEKAEELRAAIIERYLPRMGEKALREALDESFSY
ncbi:MAG: hypothetical protein IJ317_03075 [Clostridia bacterium]|nr:hypothetical protein [Clostridia bacterium]